MDPHKLIADRIEVGLSISSIAWPLNPRTKAPLTIEERKEWLARSFYEICAGMGFERFLEVPVERLVRFSLKAIENDHDTKGLLKSLLNSFMIAYSAPETSDHAYRALLTLESLRGQVADARGQKGSAVPVLSQALAALEALMARRYPPAQDGQPVYKIFVGADRLFVSSALEELQFPTSIEGITVERMPTERVSTLH